MADDETLSPREKNFRARQAQAARASSAAWADSSSRAAGPCDPRCIPCALAARDRARKLAPRVSHGEFKVFDRSTWGPNAGGEIG